MTVIQYKADDNSFDLTMDGHAGYAPAGSDIVCAGISALLFALCRRLDDVSSDADIDLREDGGSAHIRSSGRQSMEAFYTVLSGLDLIASYYPEYITIKKL